MTTQRDEATMLSRPTPTYLASGREVPPVVVHAEVVTAVGTQTRDFPKEATSGLEKDQR